MGDTKEIDNKYDEAMIRIALHDGLVALSERKPDQWNKALTDDQKKACLLLADLILMGESVIHLPFLNDPLSWDDDRYESAMDSIFLHSETQRRVFTGDEDEGYWCDVIYRPISAVKNVFKDVDGNRSVYYAISTLITVEEFVDEYLL